MRIRKIIWLGVVGLVCLGLGIGCATTKPKRSLVWFEKPIPSAPKILRKPV